MFWLCLCLAKWNRGYEKNFPCLFFFYFWIRKLIDWNNQHLQLWHESQSLEFVNSAETQKCELGARFNRIKNNRCNHWHPSWNVPSSQPLSLKRDDHYGDMRWINAIKRFKLGPFNPPAPPQTALWLQVSSSSVTQPHVKTFMRM